MFSFIKNLFLPKPDMAKLLTEGAMIIDVRTNAEYNAGHIKGSKNIPLDTIQSSINEIKKYNKPVITVCRSGSRSAVARASSNLQVYKCSMEAPGWILKTISNN